MSRIGIFGYSVSDSVQILRTGLVAAGLLEARVLMSSGESRFRGRVDDFVINYGSSNQDNVRRVTHNAVVFNPALAVSKASNKLTTYNVLSRDTGIKQLETTTDIDHAGAWLAGGYGVYCRTTINGHSGEGIIYVAQEEPEDLGSVSFDTSLPAAAMYTKAMVDERVEYRVHVAFGQVILIQQKRRRNGWRENENYSDVVRNWDSGWIYATSGIDMTVGSADICTEAIAALGLDFGAVDLIVQHDVATVVEINTAPGLQGDSSREAYVGAFVNQLSHLVDFSPLEAEQDSDLATAVPPSSGSTFSETVRSVDASDNTPWIAWDETESLDTNPGIGIIQSEEEVAAMVADINRHQQEMLTSTSGVSTPAEEVTEASVAARLDAIFGSATPLFGRDPVPSQRPTETDGSQEGITQEPQEPIISIDDLIDSGTSRRARFIPMEEARREPMAPIPNTLGSDEAPAPMINTVPLNGPGHYVADISEGVRTVICVLNSGEIYSAEHDLYLQAVDISVVSQINL
jgi:glutathione synthase/RimK-type ligase-like ATP-grasp enzyme